MEELDLFFGSSRLHPLSLLLEIVHHYWQLPMNMLSVMWALHLLGIFIGRGVMNNFGIVSWRPLHLWSIFTAPFIHANWWHLIGNSVPLLIFGSVVASQGNPELSGFLAAYPQLATFSRFTLVTLASLIASGLGAFILGKPGRVTVGASGVVFGYFGYVVTYAMRVSEPSQMIIAVILLLGWGISMLKGVLPRLGSRISWQGHLFGMLGGILLAWSLTM